MKTNNYQRNKEKARNKAVKWQEIASKKSLSYMALNRAGNYFYKIGKRYGLLKEFKENAIL